MGALQIWQAREREAQGPSSASSCRGAKTGSGHMTARARHGMAHTQLPAGQVT